MREPRSRPCALQVLHAYAIPELCSSALCPLRISRQIPGNAYYGGPAPLRSRARARPTCLHWSLAPWHPPGIACSTILEPRSSALPCVQSLLPIPAFPTGQYLRGTSPPGIPSFQVQVYPPPPPPPPAKDICVASPLLTPCAVLSSGTCSQPA